MKQAKLSDKLYEIPYATRHDFALASGRNLSYYTFDDSSNETENLKPVLYFHGFPGCGLEGAVCASEVANAGGKLHAPDRPGLGHSDGYNGSMHGAEQQLESFVNDLWEFIIANKWKVFSIVAVSGGGPFALAFLATYLEKNKKQSDNSTLPKLDSVSLVACVCCSAGTDGMMETNKTLMNLVPNQDKLLYRFVLNLMFAIPYYLVKILPSSWLLKLTPTKELPVPDQELMSNTQVSSHMIKVLLLAFRQGYSAAVNEACIIFRPKQECEEILFEAYSKQSKLLPQIAIYQGDLDVNVPKSHAKYMQEVLFQNASSLVEYPNLGHLSLVVTKANDYSGFALGKGSAGLLTK